MPKKSASAKASGNGYDADAIQTLEGLEAVRKRPGMYIGGTGSQGLMHLIWELIDNAVDEAAGGHATRIDVTLHRDKTVEVSDNGRGISEANAGQVFDHFFTTARPEGNSGLGLSIVKALLEAHDGSIRLAASTAGTLFQIEIPLTTK